MKELYSLVDDHIHQYENGTIAISDDIEFSMRKTVRQITHYILSKYMDGGADNIDPVTKQRRAFRNIGNAIVDIEWRAKNIDRKSIEGHATDGDFLLLPRQAPLEASVTREAGLLTPVLPWREFALANLYAFTVATLPPCTTSSFSGSPNSSGYSLGC